MKLDARALAWSTGLLWGGAMLLCSLANLIFPGYATAFLEWTASVYPGYDGPAGLGSVVMVTLYGLVDGAIGGYVLAWLYNTFAAGGRGEAVASRP